MLSRIFDLGWNVGEKLPVLKRPLIRWWYQFISKLDHNGNIRLMNYGYAALEGDGDLLLLEERDQINRSQIQLYHRVASSLPLAGLNVLEVGSGRGGGASFITRYHKPHSYIALDLSPRAIAFCQNDYVVNGLTFVCGDAESLTFADDSFEAVINIESSSHYPHLARFLSEVFRVLRPGGHFLWADIRTVDEMTALRSAFRNAGFQITEEERITPNTLRALELDEAHKMDIIRAHMPRPFHSSLREFVAAKGTRQYLNFQHGRREYWRAVLQKPSIQQ